MIAFCPANAEIVVVMSAFPRLISGKLGRLGVEAVMVAVDQLKEFVCRAILSGS
jgi:hypothetical protein